MTDKQINAAIAEACGWTDFVVHPEFGLMGTPPNTHGLRTAVDWYTVDLNAMHEAEEFLSGNLWEGINAFVTPTSLGVPGEQGLGDPGR